MGVTVNLCQLKKRFNRSKKISLCCEPSICALYQNKAGKFFVKACRVLYWNGKMFSKFSEQSFHYSALKLRARHFWINKVVCLHFEITIFWNKSSNFLHVNHGFFSQLLWLFFYFGQRFFLLPYFVSFFSFIFGIHLFASI